jgi:predicted DNA-binding transcriptional regulator YafY
MRADRLVAILLMLQRRGQVTAGQVAAELEVSERTARRDLEALSGAGIPVYSQQGRGGGWALLGGGRTDLSGLSATEARALFLVAGPSAGATPALKAALRKLVRALPEPLRADAESAAASVVVDPVGWGRTPRRFEPPHLHALQAATVDGRQVRLGYSGRGGDETVRVVDPLGLAVKATVWYLMAHTDAGLRTFRVDRVTSVEVTGEAVERPPGFDLEQAWERIVATVDDLRSPVRVEAIVGREQLHVLGWIFGRLLEVGSTRGDGRVEVTIGGQRIEVVTTQLAGFGESVEVTAPAAAREHLARIGDQLCRLYASSPRGVAE